MREWKIDSTLPPGFKDQVWKRIAREQIHTAPGPWTMIRNWVETTFNRPAPAAAYVVLLVFVGLSAGAWQAHTKENRTVAELQTRYVLAVDPYKTHP